MPDFEVRHLAEDSSFATIYLPHFCASDLEVSLESNDVLDVKTLAILLGKKP